MKNPIKVTYYPAKFSDYSHSDSGVIIILVCHVILQDLVIKGYCDFRGEPHMVSNRPAKFDGYKHCCSSNMIILVVEGQDSFTSIRLFLGPLTSLTNVWKDHLATKVSGN